MGSRKGNRQAEHRIIQKQARCSPQHKTKLQGTEEWQGTAICNSVTQALTAECRRRLSSLDTTSNTTLTQMHLLGIVRQQVQVLLIKLLGDSVQTVLVRNAGDTNTASSQTLQSDSLIHCRTMLETQTQNHSRHYSPIPLHNAEQVYCTHTVPESMLPPTRHLHSTAR